MPGSMLFFLWKYFNDDLIAYELAWIALLNLLYHSIFVFAERNARDLQIGDVLIVKDHAKLARVCKCRTSVVLTCIIRPK